MLIVIDTKYSPGNIVTLRGFTLDDARQCFAVAIVRIEHDGTGEPSVRYLCRGLVRSGSRGEQTIANGPLLVNGLYHFLETELVACEASDAEKKDANG